MANETYGDAAPAVGLLHFHGSEARKFLQGQLSNDMSLLSAERIMLAGFHNPQGRVLALLRLVAPAADQVIALLPSELAEPTMMALRRYVLRAKLTISHESSAEAIAALATQLPVIAPVVAPAARALAIASGLAQVYGATSGVFVAQMLNLDCIDAVSFSKGCYTGQEIIARAHYRGRMKRRMQRFETERAALLAPGQGVTLSDGRAAQIVDAVVRTDGRSEFLAVTALVSDSSGAAGATQGVGETLSCHPLPLPYALPE
jgi:tRNA-modifying protein YgfZ